MRSFLSSFIALIVVAGGLLVSHGKLRAANYGELELRVVDKETGELIAARMHLKDQRGKPVRPMKPANLPFLNDHFAFNGKIVLQLPLGTYTFEIERGPEYRYQNGHFTLERGAADNKTIEMHRFVNMKKEGWWSGDLSVRRSASDIETIMLADDLHVAPLTTWTQEKSEWSNKPLPAPALVEFGEQRFYHRLAGGDERDGGSLQYFNLDAPLEFGKVTGEFPSPVDFLKQAKRDETCHVNVEKPFAWDLPVWVASKRIDSISLLHRHFLRDSMLHGEAGGRPRDAMLYPPPLGHTRWNNDIYFHLLNCGLRMPPSAGSGSGVNSNPIGYNRIYVHCGEEFSWRNWWNGLKAGRVVITNGPMLRPLVNDQLPGHVFRAYPGESVELNIALNLALREPVDYLEIIRDGLTIHETRLDEWAKKNGRLPPIKFDQSGWLIVRAVTNNPKTTRFAMSAPYYVEIGDKPRISRKSARFFLDWAKQRAEKIKLASADEQENVYRYHRAAIGFWEQMAKKANVD